VKISGRRGLGGEPDGFGYDRTATSSQKGALGVEKMSRASTKKNVLG